MSINFFDNRCQETPIIDPSFGICDDRNGLKAYTNISNPNLWVATIENPHNQSITFTAIDNCIEILRGDGNQERACDGMLTYTDNLVFIELKEAAKAWIPDAIEQLETTIKTFSAHHDINEFKHKRAFACNKKHPKFQVIEPSTKKHFFDKYRVRLNIQGTIKVM
jgi:hypothetical protein